jgi:hypothetical protein
MEKVYIVYWGSGSSDDDGCAHAYSRVYGVYRTEESAKKALEACMNEELGGIYADLDPDGECPEIIDEVDVQVYGSVKEEYFEIDYTLGTDSVEVYIAMEAKELLD